MLDAADLPDDVAALKAMLIAAQAREAAKDSAIASKDEHIARKDERIERLEKLVAAFKQAAFGRKSEKTDPDQFDLALEDLETAMAMIHAEDEADTPAANRLAKPRVINRGSLPKHLPRIEEVIERLDVVPAQFRVIVTRRPQYACRACTDGVVQAPAPARLIQAGLPTEATVAHVLVSKYADHLPLYRQTQIMSRQGIDLDRSTLADWVGRAAYELRPVFDALIADLKRSTKLFMDETRAPVLDPGSRKTKTGYFWALARDDRPWGGGAPPSVAFTYAPGRGGHHAGRILQGFSGILQVDGYAGYNRLIAPERTDPDIRLAYCWAHARRKLIEITRNGTAPIAEDGVKRIGELYRIEAELRGLDQEARLAGRQEQSAPVIADMQTWLLHHRARIATKSPLGAALAYIAKYWDGLKLFLTEGRIEIDNNTVERTIRPIALNRKNALFAGHDAGAENWATIASLIETCKLNSVDPFAYLTYTLTAIVNGHKQSRIEALMPWNYQAA
ncbi:IS66 family transposase [Brucella gallinifaecis]|uniref:IS66 family transposase n=1 Tax=Brucella gallinifaecis TaxID=215590 RepID=UPI00235FB689|nr:IS66 family transposase [Brucella gallinifaecis]